MMSSVPYVPPDTIKNVAATSGHSVSFAFLFVEVTARAGNWAGRDKVLNFLSRPPSAILALSQLKMPGASLHYAEYGYSTSMQEKCAKTQRFFRRAARRKFGTVPDASTCGATPAHLRRKRRTAGQNFRSSERVSQPGNPFRSWLQLILTPSRRQDRRATTSSGRKERGFNH